MDGQKTDIQKTLDYFITVPVSKGNHSIELKYRTPYLMAGTIVSLLGTSILLWEAWKEREKDGSFADAK